MTKKNVISDGSDKPMCGRPRKEPYKKRSINIPNEYVDFLLTRAAKETEGNVNEYIISLIKKDKEAKEKLS